MKSIDVGKLIISPYEFDSILSLRIEKGLNEHSTLFVYGIIRDEKEFTPATDMTEGTNIICQNDGQVYFNGVLQSVKVTKVKVVYHVQIRAISNTILLDTVKHKRSFQDNSQSYKSIVEEVIQDNDGTVTYNASEETVENIILQYNETDWEFAKRLASHTQDVLIPITDDKPSFHLGAPDQGSGEIESREYAISKDFDLFRLMSTQEDPLTADDVKLYCVETDELICELGEKLSLNGTELHVCKISLSLVKAAIKVVYTLCAKKAITTAKFYNRAITGLALDGTVLKAEDDNVKLHLDIDEKQDEDKAHLFSYATGYSAEGHTGWYVMPEEDDKVQLLFPSEDEKFAYAASSVRQEGTDKTTDPLVKYLRTPFGKEIKLEEKEILITGKDDETFIRINEDTGIDIITTKDISIKCDGTMDIKSKKNMTVTTDENLTITAKDSIVMNCGGNRVKIDPPSGIAVSTDKQIKMNSVDDTSLDSKNMINVSSNDDMNLSSNKNLYESADSQMVLSCSGSTVRIDGDINMRARDIKEN